MLAVRWHEPFVSDEWGFEVKWDGVRTLLFADRDGVRLRSRAGNDTTATYPELADYAPLHPTILDGEVVALDVAGRPSFEQLQQRMNVRAPAAVARKVAQVPITYVVFDVLYDGDPLFDLQYIERRDRLGSIGLPSQSVRSQFVDTDPAPMWDFVRDRGIEGIVAKRLDSPYRPGQRSADWRKITVFRSMRAIVGGFTVGDGGRTDSFGSLVLGLADGDRLRWVGSVGSGFNDEQLRMIRGALDEMVVDESPFTGPVDLLRPATWVHPHLVAVVQYKEWTSAGRLRAPSFKGFTDDPPEMITWQSEGPEAPG